MRFILAIALMTCFYWTDAQDRKNEFRTEVQKAGLVEINQGTVKILKAGTVVIGKITIIQSLRTKIYLVDVISSHDSSGIYTTTYQFAPEENLPSFGIEMAIKFNAPILRIGPDDFTINALNSTYQGFSNASEDRTTIYTKGTMSTPSNTFSITVRSKQKLLATFSGIEGIYK
jgi:hypothetical protein